MVTIRLAKEKWARKMAVAGPRWKSGVVGKGPEFCRGVADFFGVPTCNPAKQAAWEAGTGAVSAEEFAAAVRGKEDKWERKLREAMIG